MNAGNSGADFMDSIDEWTTLNDAAKVRDYEGDPSTADPTEFLLSLKVPELPHPSRGLTNFSETSNFLVHLKGEHFEAPPSEQVAKPSACSCPKAGH